MTTASTTAAEGIAERETSTRKDETWLLHHRADRRQVAIVGLYVSVLVAMVFVPACRNVFCLALACWLSFLNSVVIHNVMHKGIFKSRALNRAFRCVISFGALYPASANIASHNLVHHQFDDDGQDDWAAPQITSFSIPLLNLLHFPNVAGPRTFAGVSRWARTTRQRDFREQYYLEQAVAFGLTGALMLYDFWGTVFFVLVPQLWGARGILRINLIQHEGCDVTTEWNHSRNFVGRAFNWVMCNNGYHTIHHNRAGLHWSVLAEQHEREVVERIDPALDERSMVVYLVRRFVLGRTHPVPKDRDTKRAGLDLGSRAERRDAAEAAAMVE
ncbi:MAG: fatty acid desaturase [Sandaracinus sp.]